MENQVSNTETQLVQAGEITNFAELVAKSENLDKLKPVMTLTANYIELEKPGETFRGVFIGLQEMTVNDQQTGEQKHIKAARFLINKGVYINGGVVLINELERATVPVGTSIEVKYERKEGNTKIYSITLIG
jgi:hypothetical protein